MYDRSVAAVSFAGDLHPARLLAMLGTERLGRTAVLVDRCDSTNELAAALASAGAPEGTVLTADEQSAGRGRSGRRWHSVPGKSLTFSIILRPRRTGGGITSLVSLAAARALDRVCGPVALKWPNDLYLDGRKLGGILAEARGAHVVVGVGINVNERTDDFPAGIAAEAVSLRMRTGADLDRGAILASILERFEAVYGEWLRSGFGPFRGEVEERLLYVGRRVTLGAGVETVEGLLRGMNDEGYLLLEVDGAVRVVAAGDVSLRA
jgi:BirA family biotin operon repressor/biotin-[acetyl-CoA-carboxylase] ligase